MINQINENCGTVVGKDYKCKYNPMKCISGSFSDLLTGYISDEGDTGGGKDKTQNLSIAKTETDKAENEEFYGNNCVLPLALIPSDHYSSNILGHAVFDVSSGKNSNNEGTELLEAYRSLNDSKPEISSESVTMLPFATASKLEIKNQPSVLSGFGGKPYNSYPIYATDIKLDELKVFKVSELYSEKHYNVSDANEASAVILENIRYNVSVGDLSGKFDDYAMLRYESPIVEGSGYESRSDKLLKQAELSASTSEHERIIKFSDEAKIYAELKPVTSYELMENYRELSAKVTGHSLARKDSSTLNSEQSKLANELNLEQSNESIKEFSIGKQNGQETTFVQSQHNSFSDSSFGSSNAEQFLEYNDAEKINPPPKNAFFSVAFQSDVLSKLPQALDKITSKEDILSLVADRLKVMTGEGITELEIKIHPESLGKLLLKVVNENGLYSAQITAEAFQTKELLESHLNDLKTSLKEQGFDFTRLDVNLSNNRSNNRQWAWQDRLLSGRNNSGNFVSRLSDPSDERVGRTYSRLKVSGHIDCLV